MAAWTLWRSLSVLLILGSAAALKLPFLPFIPYKTTDSTVIGDNGKVTWNGRARESNTMTFGNELILQQGLAAAANFMSNLVKGKVKTTNPIPKDTPRTEIALECLNSVAPPPLNWKMWCPGKDAKVFGWVDKSGAAHREVIIRPQKELTTTMVQWFLATYVLGLGDPVVKFQGKNYYFYHLWHPLDHVETGVKMAPALHPENKGLPLYTLIHERYRNPSSFPFDRHYETNGWFFVEDPLGNAMKNRLVMDMNILGMNALTNRVEFKDTDDGLMIRFEIILGVPPRGYDAKNPDAGSFAASTFNDMLMGPLIESFRNTPDLDESMNAVIRHMIEEYSNLRHFVPELYSRYSGLAAAGVTWVPTLGTFLDRLDITATDQPTVNFYEKLRQFVEGLPKVDLSNTKVGKAIIQRAEAVSDVLTHSPISAMNASATPDKIKRPPEFDSVVRTRDQAAATMNSMASYLSSNTMSAAMAAMSGGSSSSSEAQNALARLSALHTRATGLVESLGTSISGLDGMVRRQVVGKVSAAAVELANTAAHDVEVKAYQLTLMRDAMMAILKGASSSGSKALPVDAVKQQPQSSVYVQPQSSVGREQPQSSVYVQLQSSVGREQPQSSTKPAVLPATTARVAASASLPLAPANSVGIQFDASLKRLPQQEQQEEQLDYDGGMDVVSDQEMLPEDLATFGRVFSGGMFAGLADSLQQGRQQGGVTAKAPATFYASNNTAGSSDSGSGGSLLPAGPTADDSSNYDEYLDEQDFYADDQEPAVLSGSYNLESAALPVVGKKGASAGVSAGKGAVPLPAAATAAAADSSSSSKSSVSPKKTAAAAAVAAAAAAADSSSKSSVSPKKTAAAAAVAAAGSKGADVKSMYQVGGLSLHTTGHH